MQPQNSLSFHAHLFKRAKSLFFKFKFSLIKSDPPPLQQPPVLRCLRQEREEKEVEVEEKKEEEEKEEEEEEEEEKDTAAFLSLGLVCSCTNYYSGKAGSLQSQKDRWHTFFYIFALSIFFTYNNFSRI